MIWARYLRDGGHITAARGTNEGQPDGHQQGAANRGGIAHSRYRAAGIVEGLDGDCQSAPWSRTSEHTDT